MGLEVVAGGKKSKKIEVIISALLGAADHLTQTTHSCQNALGPKRFLYFSRRPA